MTRRVITILLVSIFCFTSLYAEGTVNKAISVQLSPYSIQWVNRSSKSYRSNNGVNGLIGYRRSIKDNFHIGADIDYSLYRYDELDELYSIIGLTGLVGLQKDISPKFFLTGELGAGTGIRAIGDVSRFVLGVKLHAGLGYKISESGNIFLGVDAKMGIQDGSSNIALLPNVGLMMKL